ncbi:hypothetical protein ACFYP6_37580 [Streptomyces goshikiensis]|uniref:hypothetical protein n=1 Tax=Streptomyces goshikiensis TaxID=1942 RepID=UPI00367647B1
MVTTGTVSYTFDNADRRTTMTAVGTTTAYSFDRSSVLTGVKTGTQEVSFSLDAVGRQKTPALPGGITRTTDYDKADTITSVVYKRGGQALCGLNYTLDNRGLQARLGGTLAQHRHPRCRGRLCLRQGQSGHDLQRPELHIRQQSQLKNNGVRACA